MKWYEAKSPEDLKKLGNLKSVKLLINSDLKKLINIKDINTFIKIGSNSWKGLYTKIENLLKICNEYCFISTSNTNIDAHYFKSKAEEYIFYLLELDGEIRMDKLKIYKSHYMNKSIANKWYKDIAKIIHPDTCDAYNAEKAMAELTNLYEKMISK